MINHIIFDVGKVLFDYRPPKIVRNLLPNHPNHAFFIQELHHSQLWQDLDHGIITPNEVVTILNRKYGHSIEKEILTILNNFIHELDPIENMIHLFKTFSKTHPVYILSNFQKEPFLQLRQTHPFLNEATGIVVSAEEKLMKPNPELYLRLLNRYSIPAKEALFIDDRPENIDTALSLGMSGIVFESYEQTIKEIARLQS